MKIKLRKLLGGSQTTRSLEVMVWDAEYWFVRGVHLARIFDITKSITPWNFLLAERIKAWFDDPLSR